MPIVEHAFSYGGLLIRTFRRSDAPPPPSLPSPAPDASEPPWTSEQLPPPKRRKGAWERIQDTSSGTCARPSPGTTTPELAHAYTGREPPTPAPTDPSSAGIELDASDPAKQGTPEEQRTRHEPWIPPASERGRLHSENEWQGRTGGAVAPVRYMQETGCATDVDRFAVEAGVRGQDTGVVDYDPVYRPSYGVDTAVDRAEAQDAEVGVEDRGGYVQRPLTLSPPPPPPPAINKFGLYFPTFSTKLPDGDTPAHSALAPAPAPPPSPPTATAPNPKRGRGRPQKPEETTHPVQHYATPSALLSQITQAIASSTASFIPRPLLVTYTLPIPALEADYKPFALALVRGISAADHFVWAVAHSQWTSTKTHSAAGARWVCNLSEEVRDRGG
ncbi:hypothetical protein Q9L58_006945 [Maublancomyces gigas]|uniref:Uncharacterized protein n=1 Tax=Discina gigas TaxID=1032678 RepID=A0ABR3GDW6_9PEZI